MKQSALERHGLARLNGRVVTAAELQAAQNGAGRSGTAKASVASKAGPVPAAVQAEIDGKIAAAIKRERAAMSALLMSGGAAGHVMSIGAALGEKCGPKEIGAMIAAGSLPSDEKLAAKMAANREAKARSVWNEADAINGR